MDINLHLYVNGNRYDPMDYVVFASYGNDEPMKFVSDFIYYLRRGYGIRNA